MRILVTGASGFIGRALCRHLKRRGHRVLALVRCASGRADEIVAGDIGAWSRRAEALAGCQAVVHLAARVHGMPAAAGDERAAFRAVNTEATLNLARQCAAAGVRRLVFTSSVKVNGQGRDFAYTEADAPAPPDAYAISKLEAEQGLRQIEAATPLQVVCLRPPLVYGPGVKGNFYRLMQILDKGLPLPLAAVRNARSLIYLGNLVDAISACLVSPAAAGQTFLVADARTPSTPELIRLLAAALNRPARLFPVPEAWLRAAAAGVARAPMMDRLTGSFRVDTTGIRTILGWRAPFSMRQGLEDTARWYQGTQRACRGDKPGKEP